MRFARAVVSLTLNPSCSHPIVELRGGQYLECSACFVRWYGETGRQVEHRALFQNETSSQIVGCSCGWAAPTENSVGAYVEHAFAVREPGETRGEVEIARPLKPEG